MAIVRYRCDVPMARKKGVIRFCNRKCKECLCAIKTDGWGREEHNGDMDQGCGNFTIRNLSKMSGQDRTGKRGRPISYRGEEL